MGAKTEIYTDGAASGNPGPAGWGVVMVLPDGSVREFGGSAEGGTATNNQMELQAVIEGLKAIEAGPAKVYSDSKYVLTGITEWIHNWKRRGWKTAAGKPVLNKDLWIALEGEVERLGRDSLEWEWVPGHSGHALNERADQIAVSHCK